MREWGNHYCFGLKANQPTLHEYAMRVIASKQCPARSRTKERAVVRELWTHALAPDEVDFPGARLLLLVRQQHWDDENKLVVEDYRYFVTSLDTTVFNFNQLLRLVRVHWGIENRHNWTLDVVLVEDARQPCRPMRTALEVVAWLWAMAFNLLYCFSARLPLDGRPSPRGVDTRPSHEIADTRERIRPAPSPASGGRAPSGLGVEGQ
ncbi:MULTISPECIES: hypothetical protein [Myxococcus]|uniref:hypothetical protein n=1 Tax=Myxococcus TaxID=32 RepID=UPI001143B397|nr:MULTISPECIES: hypothetical protein [Myxococcus]NOK00688.1 hypothetical protein [Myxococcus xanthus]